MTKVCINCHTESPIEEALCSECGMSLTRAPTKEELELQRKARRELAEQWRSGVGEAPSASGIVYLFGEQFARPVPPVTLVTVARSYFGGEPPFTWGRGGRSPIRAPYSGQSVWKDDLATRLFEAAFVYLVQGGYIFLRVQKRKGLLRATEAVAITLQKSGDDLSPSLERAIMEALRGDPKEDCVKSVVGRLIGGRDWDPPQRVVEMVVQALAETGWLCPGEVPVVEATAPLLGEVEAVKARLHNFATELPHLQQSLLRQIQAGMTSRLL